jgi:hypothetical protein
MKMEQRCYHCGFEFHGFRCPECQKLVDAKDLRLSPFDYFRFVPAFIELEIHSLRNRTRIIRSERARKVAPLTSISPKESTINRL